MIHMESVLSCERDHHETIIILDELGRPQSIPSSPNALALNQHFQKWVEEKASLESEIHVGPSDFIHGNQDIIEKMRDASLALDKNSNDIPPSIPSRYHIPPSIPSRYHHIWEYPYRQIGDEPGLYKRCNKLEIIPPRSRTYYSLRMRYYLFRKQTDENDGDENAGVGAALQWDPDEDRNRISGDDSTCLTSRILTQLLFG